METNREKAQRFSHLALHESDVALTSLRAAFRWFEKAEGEGRELSTNDMHDFIAAARAFKSKSDDVELYLFALLNDIQTSAKRRN